MHFSIKWIFAVMVYVAIAAMAFGHPSWLFPDVLWSFSIFANVYAATLVVFAREQHKAAALAFVLASIGFVGFRLVSGFFNIGGFFPVDNFFLELGIDATRPDPDTLLRLRAGNAVAALIFGLIGAVVGLQTIRTVARPKTEH